MFSMVKETAGEICMGEGWGEDVWDGELKVVMFRWREVAEGRD